MPMGIGLGIGVTRGGGVGWWPAGSELALEFDNGRGFNSIDRTKTTPDSILTYTNPSAKMVYGSDGVLRYAPHNLCLQSQTFNTTWSLGSNSVTDNQDAAPDGTTTADLVTMVVASGVFQTIAVTASTTYTFSFWAKRGTKTNLQYRVYNNTGAANITAPTSYYSSTSAGAFSRITHTFTTPAGCISLRVYIDDSNDGTSGTFLVWGAQLNLGSSALTYIPTTTAAVYSLPIDHNPTTFAPLGVLIEEQRVNLLTYSEQFDTADWAKTRATISANSTTAPDGTTTADRITDNSATGSNTVTTARIVTLTLSATYTWSAYLKADQLTMAALRTSDFTTPGNTASYFDLSAGTVLSTGAGHTATISAAGGGWYRCAITFALGGADNAGQVQILPIQTNGVLDVDLDGTSSIFIWGAQLEAGAFATSYIPTVASQVTRLADQVSILTSAFGYNAAAGTMAFEGAARTAGTCWSIDDGTTNERLTAYDASGTPAFFVVDGGFTQALLTGAAVTNGVVYKQAAAWAANDFASSLNGAAVLTDGAGTLPTVTSLKLGQRATGIAQLNSHIKRLTYFPTRRSDADLQVLTT